MKFIVPLSKISLISILNALQYFISCLVVVGIFQYCVSRLFLIYQKGVNKDINKVFSFLLIINYGRHEKKGQNLIPTQQTQL